MDEVVRKIAALGLPGVILLVAMATTGLTGAAAITTALAFVPGGMLAGIAFLGMMGLASEALTKYGLSSLLTSIYLERLQKGENAKQLVQEILDLWISDDLKRELIVGIVKAILDSPISEDLKRELIVGIVKAILDSPISEDLKRELIAAIIQAILDSPISEDLKRELIAVITQAILDL